MICFAESGFEVEVTEIELRFPHNPTLKPLSTASFFHCSTPQYTRASVWDRQGPCSELLPLTRTQGPQLKFQNMSQVDSFKHSETWNLCPPVSQVIQVHCLSKWIKDSLSSDTASLQDINKTEALSPLHIWYPSSVISPPKQLPVKLLSVKSYFQFLI